MSTKHRDFDAGRPRPNLEPRTFTLKGESYAAVPRAPGAAVLAVAASSDGTSGEKVKAYYDFLDSVLEDESVPRFIAALKRKVNPIEIEDVGELVGWLVEGYSEGRPTQLPSPSPAGQSTTGTPSTGAAWPTA